MKKQLLILPIIVILFSFNVFAQDKLLGILPLKDGKVTYDGVVQVDSINKDELYKRAKRWFIETYKSAKDVIQLDDKENGEVIGKGFFEIYWQVTFMSGQNINVWQTMKIQVKDGRYRYEITDFNVKYYVSASQYSSGANIDSPLEAWNKGRDDNSKKIYTKIDTEVKSLISSLEKFVRTPPKDDW